MKLKPTHLTKMLGKVGMINCNFIDKMFTYFHEFNSTQQHNKIITQNNYLTILMTMWILLEPRPLDLNWQNYTKLHGFQLL